MSILGFRALVLASAVLYIVWYFLPSDALVGGDFAAANLLKLDGYGAIFTTNHWFFTVVLFVLWMIAYVELLRLRTWGRYLYLGLTVWALIAAALYGYRVSSPLEEVLGLVIDLLDGAILALVFLSPLREKFWR